MEPETLTITIDDRDTVTALLYPASKAKRSGITVILGHGAGANQLSSFMVMIVKGLAVRGCDVMTFNFVYKERGRSIPDPKVRLESCYKAVINTAQKNRKLKKNRLVIGGKSMGGRIASQVAAVAPDGIGGLVFFGYPLHPPGRPDKLRDAHLNEIHAPMLFVQGERDTFGTGEEICAVIKRLHLPATLHVIEGGDHSLKVPKRVGGPQEKIYATILDKVAAWLQTN